MAPAVPGTTVSEIGVWLAGVGVTTAGCMGCGLGVGGSDRSSGGSAAGTLAPAVAVGETRGTAVAVGVTTVGCAGCEVGVGGKKNACEGPMVGTLTPAAAVGETGSSAVGVGMSVAVAETDCSVTVGVSGSTCSA